MKHQSKRTNAFRTVLIALVCMGITACQSRAVKDDADGFPDPARSGIPEGIFVNLDNARQFTPGLTKRQVHALLGTPHFNEGMWGVREWNYLFNFRRDGGPEYYKCQLRVRYDKDGLVESGQWHPRSCQTLLNPPPPPPPPPAPVATLPDEPLRLAADALFAFDSAELTAPGSVRIDALVQQVRAASRVQEIVVRGYTDRIGTDPYNRDLSYRRAEAVRGYLVSNGVASAAISAEGLGSASPLVECAGVSGAPLIDCLAPNRRVEISASGYR